MGVSIQQFTVLGNVANPLLNSYLHELTSTRTNHDDKRLKQLFMRSMIVQWGLTIVGNLSIIFILPILLKLVGVSTELLPTLWLAILGLTLFLEQNHSSFALLITLTNRVPFVKSLLISGTVIIVVSLILMNMNYGIGALILTQGLIQLAYNNWYWPYMVVRGCYY